MTHHGPETASYETHNFVGIFRDPDLESGATVAREDYMAPVDKATVLDNFRAGFSPRLLSVIKLVSPACLPSDPTIHPAPRTLG